MHQFCRAILLSVFLCIPFVSNAQFFSNFDPEEDLFKYEVKNIDEFIDRFNDDTASYLHRMYVKDHGASAHVPRQQLVVSVFDLGNSSFSGTAGTAMAFLRQVLDVNNPVLLSFTDTGWYARASAIFARDGKLVVIPLILRVESWRDEWVKWIITGVGKEAPYMGPAPSISVPGNHGKAPTYISTSAYVTNFVELHYIFKNLKDPGLYFDKAFLSTDQCRLFISAIAEGQLRFKCVNNIIFHFYQVPGWIFSVKQYNRRTLNSGWLISDLVKADSSEKNMQRCKLLCR